MERPSNEYVVRDALLPWGCQALRFVFADDNGPLARYLTNMQHDPIIRLCQTVGSTSRAAGSYKPR
jgi:hypothetical protein